MMKKKLSYFNRYCLILLLLLSSAIHAQNNAVRGVVKTTSGETLIGVSVVIKGTGTGSITDENGNFSIQASRRDTLAVTYVGYIPQSIPVKSEYMEIVLEENTIVLDNIVVIGYGSVKKSDLTGSVATVKMDDLKDIPANSIENLLQGRSAGLQVINTSQDPGAGATVRIRGGSSLRGSNSPLLVVDGFPLGDAGNLKQINTADITSIEVLKDASASSIYGSRGANGVIIVTTKKAKKGVTTVNVKQQVVISQFASEFIQWTNPALMAQLDNEAKINGGIAPLYIGAVNSTGIYYPSVKEIEDGTWPFYTDWTKEVFRNTPMQSITSASVNSSSEKTSYNLSASYLDQDGVFIKDDYGKGTASLNLKHEFSKSFSISTINNMSKDWRNNNTGLSYWRNPLWPVYNDDGSYFLAGNADYDHPIAWTNHKKNKSEGTDFISSWIFDWQIYKDLNIKSHINYKYGESLSDRFDPDKYTENGTNNKGAAYIDNWKGNNYTVETYLTYDKEFLKKHKLNAMLGHSYEYTIARTSNLESYDFKNGALANENMGAGNPELNRHRNGQTKTKLLSYMGRLNYTYNDRYLLTLTMRADGSSKFSENHKWAYFPSGAISWKMHHEDFIKNLNIFDELKWRFSYGISGNQGISPYQTLSRYGIENFYNEGTWNTAIGPGYVIGYTGVGGRYKAWGGIPNKDLKWETTSQYNIGVDMAFLNHRLRVTADYYDKRTKDLLRERYLPLSSGYDRMWVNDGEIGNKGIEVTIDADIIDTKDWGFSGTFIFSKNKNKVISLGNAVSAGLSTDYLTGIQYEYYGNGVDPFRETSPNILAVGLPVNVFYGYKVNGILQSDKEGAAAGLIGAEAKAGEYHYLDLSQDGVFDTNDRTIIGDPNPDFMASLNLRFRYKQFDASVFFNGVFGNDVLWSGMYNSAKYVPLRWTPDNPTNTYPSARQGRLYYASDWFVKDGSFLRIQNLNLGYNFSSSKIKWLKNVRLYLNAENLYTFTKFEGYDPEVGLDGRYSGGYPKLRKYTIGLDITF
ncbi:TonB-dependent receptor [uncultured Dysgonomonas sp.]|uniref:TonB-linked outer membrane protein, SusC/RagA family n=1 Tax=uncultured Dysgonomonas sp. TaxID=206096 RepID=A0A212K567_9BACT|nr:TonB-dependent receptor [uncultured Dysgonomonas sp.]SBW06864.1 TonB-linked outer membrane protein, SusC/RagA family [uncultured Dysgonomonas sp.]